MPWRSGLKASLAKNPIARLDSDPRSITSDDHFGNTEKGIRITVAMKELVQNQREGRTIAGWGRAGRLWIAAPLIALVPCQVLLDSAFLQAIVLGVVQGLTEFLPVSSTGHLIVVSKILGWPAPSVALSAVLELGSILAVVAYLWSDCIKILQGSIRALRQGDRSVP